MAEKGVSVLLIFSWWDFFFHTQINIWYLNSLFKQLCCLFPPPPPTQKVSASHSLKGGWRKLLFSFYRELRDGEAKGLIKINVW